MKLTEQRDNYAITVLLHQLSLFSLGSTGGRKSSIQGAVAPCRPRTRPPDLSVNIITTSDSGPFVRLAARRRAGTKMAHHLRN